MDNNDELKHVGVIGMKWGRRRAESAARATGRDAASLREHGYKKEAAAVQKVSDTNRAKAKALGQKIDRIDKKRLMKKYGFIKDRKLSDLRELESVEKAHQRRAVKIALATVGTLAMMDFAATKIHLI